MPNRIIFLRSFQWFGRNGAQKSLKAWAHKNFYSSGKFITILSSKPYFNMKTIATNQNILLCLIGIHLLYELTLLKQGIFNFNGKCFENLQKLPISRSSKLHNGTTSMAAERQLWRLKCL